MIRGRAAAPAVPTPLGVAAVRHTTVVGVLVVVSPRTAPPTVRVVAGCVGRAVGVNRATGGGHVAVATAQLEVGELVGKPVGEAESTGRREGR